MTNLDMRVGDTIRFAHYGKDDRLGRIVKLTPGAVHIEWTSNTGTMRVVAVARRHLGDKRIRLLHRATEEVAKL